MHECLAQNVVGNAVRAIPPNSLIRLSLYVSLSLTHMHTHVHTNHAHRHRHHHEQATK